MSACEKQTELLDQQALLNKEIQKTKVECENEKHDSFYQEFFVDESDKQNFTLRKLLEGLMKFHKNKKEADNQYYLPFRQFVDMFRRDTPGQEVNFKRQHVFEMICRALLLFGYDRGSLGTNKKFYDSLENFTKGNKKSVSCKEMLESQINEGSKAGKVDIFFKTSIVKSKPDEKKFWCERKTEDYLQSSYESKSSYEPKSSYEELYPYAYSPNYDAKFSPHTPDFPPEPVEKLILIQNKYYSKEKTDIKSYDITDIYALASEYKKLNNNIEYEIVLMVNDKGSLNSKLARSKNNNKNIVKSEYIFGMEEMETWFQLMLYDMVLEPSFDKFVESRCGKPSDKLPLVPRFHQTLFTETTMKYFVDEGYKKFIWGAVPRSGKSYMIADLISRRESKNVLIILGAKTETLTQFENMFKDLANFNQYSVITATTKKPKSAKNIYLFSQEWFKVSGENDKKFTDLFSGETNIDIYFDEIHKGGSTDKSEKILDTLSKTMRIDIFIMVTATFAKPNIRYETNFIDTKPPKIIQWSYEDQQNMKHIESETSIDMIVSTRKGMENEETIESKTIREIFEKYKTIYNTGYIDVIRKEYEKHPELVLVNADKQESNKYNINEIFIKNLKCDACSQTQTLEDLRNPANVFDDVGRVTDILDFFANPKKDNTVNSGLYFDLSKMKAPIKRPHSELWFLPSNSLYLDPIDCRTICGTNKETDDETNPQSLPNIEALTRGLSFKLMQHTYFKKRYNILIVHGGSNIKYGNHTIRDIYDKHAQIKYIYDDNKNVSVSDEIRKYEAETLGKGKSLIILTGAKLRLGISLPCVDIAFNFDNTSSVDLNYQTMFRVLTERPGKKHGYYVDMQQNRLINFLYEFNTIYGSGFGRGKNFVKQLQGLILLFNIDGFGLTTENQVDLYNKLIQKLKLSQDDYQSYYSTKTNITNLVAASLQQLDYQDIKTSISKLIGKISNPKTSKIALLVQGEKSERLQNNGEEEDEEEDEEDDPDSAFISRLAELIPAYVVLLAVFSEGSCETIEECLELCKENIRAGGVCNCETQTDANILVCYSGLTPTNLLKVVNAIKQIINQSEQLRDSINFIFSNIIAMVNNTAPLIMKMNPEDIEHKIIEYLPVRQDKKDKNGEVFTPKSLIDEMMDKIPASVWKDPSKKWLDPANGIGNFPMVVFQKLVEKLPDKYDGPNGKYSGEEGKKKHILKNMLYMAELDPTNVKISRRIFGKDANICCANFLEQEDKWRKEFGLTPEDKFDIIIGNPPFQREQEGKREGGYGGRTLWDQFIKKSFELLINNGFLGFITPPPWRKPESELYELMTQEHQLLYLHIYNKKQGQELFHVSQRVDLYIIEKTPKYKNTHIVDENGDTIELDLSKWAFLPNYAYKNIKKIMTSEEDGIKVIYSSAIYETRKPYVKETKTDKYKYPIVHSINQDGFVFWYTDDKSKGHFGVPKVLLNFNENQYPVNDYEGKYGMSQITFGIPITSKKQGDVIVKTINSDEFKEIIKATKWGAFQTDWRMFKYFRPDFYKDFLNSKSKTPEPSVSSLEETQSQETPSKEKSSSNTPKTGTKRVNCKKGTRRYKAMGSDCYTADEITKWKNTQKNIRLNKTKKKK